MRHNRIVPNIVRICSRDAARLLLAPAFADLAHEELRVVHLDGSLRMLKVTAIQGLAWVELPIRTIIADALALGSRGLLLAHNHPCGDPTPSRSDRTATTRLVDVARPLGIRVVDHLIFAGAAASSFQALGLL